MATRFGEAAFTNMSAAQTVSPCLGLVEELAEEEAEDELARERGTGSVQP